MDKQAITTVLNRHVFETEKAYIIRKIAEDPDRFLGVFRSTTPRLKLIQYVLQSREIRFGDALEEIVRAMLESRNFITLERRVTLTENTALDFDQYFSTPDSQRFYLVEQKIRDDHDSSKKTGQIDNFKKKLGYLKRLHESQLEGIMYFIDPSLKKNMNYYREQCQKLNDELGIPVRLYYNGEFFQSLVGDVTLWNLLESTLLEWRMTVPTDVQLNCDEASDREQVLCVEPTIWYKLVSYESLWTSGVMKCVFPTGESLRDLSILLAQNGTAKFWCGRRKCTNAALAAMIRERVLLDYNLNYDLPGASDRLF